MFDAVRNNKRIVQIFLGLIALPFAFFGVDSYVRNSGVGNDVASVGKTKITVQQFEQALRDRQDQMRQSLGPSFQPELMQRPEIRQAVLNNLIDQRLLLLEAEKNGLRVVNSVVTNAIGRIPAFQEDGKFSLERYETMLRGQGMSPQQFEANIRQDLTLQQLLGAVGESALVGSVQAEALLRIQNEERRFSELRFQPEQYAAKVKLDAAAVQKFYDENTAQFEVPEQVKAEYVLLSLDSLLAQVTVSDAEVKAWYEGRKDRFQQPEERRASHILITPEGDDAKAKARAEALLAELQKTPGKFAELARKHSQDPGTAQQGGDLGFFGRGMMVKSFEDTVFALKDGELSGVVKSDFGYHLIRLTGIKPGKLRPLEEVRAEIESELKRQAAMRKYAETAESFNNTVYEQSDSLQPAAEKYKLKVQKSGWLSKQPDPRQLATLGPLATPKVLAGLFSEDAIKNRRNTEAIEVGPNTLLAARVVEHQAAAVRPFAEVKGEVETLLRAREAARLAREAGEAKLAELQAGGEKTEKADKAAWSPVRGVTRLQGRQLPAPAVQSLFKAKVDQLPAYAGADLGGGYAIYKIVKVERPEKVDPAQLKSLQEQFAGIVGQEDMAAYLSALRLRHKVEINRALVAETRER